MPHFALTVVIRPRGQVVATFARPVVQPPAAAKMAGETQPRAEQAIDITDQAILEAKEALKSLLLARNAETPLLDAEIGSIDTLVGVAVSAGFHKGKWLSDAEHGRK